jgi:hypothetical protein
MDSPKIVYESKLQVFEIKGISLLPIKQKTKVPSFFLKFFFLGALTHTLADLVFAVIS